jgi:hypothetical protein
MNENTDSPGEDAASRPPYRSPQKLLVPCPNCGATILRGLFIDGRIKRLPQPLTPVFGEVHTCKEMSS